MLSQGKVWFITGVSRGFGLALLDALIARGDTVVGTTRDGASPGGRRHERLTVLPLEVTSTAQVDEAIAQAWQVRGRVDVVVNNAGYGVLGAVEDTTLEAAQHNFDVNFFGTLRVIRAALPRLRAQKRGHIINFSSIAGLASRAGGAIYGASKYAVEGLSEGLAQEVAPLGIRVTVVEPGAFRTDFLSSHSIRLSAQGAMDYAPTAGKVVDALSNFDGKQQGDPGKLAQVLIEVADDPEPPLHLVLGSDALGRVHAKLAEFQAELRRWEPVGRTTDIVT